MTVESPPRGAEADLARLEAEVDEPSVSARQAPDSPRSTAPATGPRLDDDETPAPNLGRSALAVALTTTAAAWMVGGVFDGAAPRLLALVAAAGGIAWSAATFRFERAGVLRILFPLAVAAAAIVAVEAGGSHLSPYDAISTAVSSGGLSDPPVPFEPGWRAIVVALCALLGGSTLTLVASGARPRLSLMLPIPVVVAAALVQPTHTDVASAAVALVLVVAGIMVLYGAELGGGEQVRLGFELRRSARGLGAMAVAVVALLALNQANVLFPGQTDQRNLPPQRPQVTPLDQAPDRVLFTVTTSPTTSGPWRLGTLDVYEDGDFLLPPYDTSRLEPAGVDLSPVSTHATETVSFTLAGLDSRVLPDVANPLSVTQSAQAIVYDPRTQGLTAQATPAAGVSYTVTAPLPPTGDDMATAKPESPRSFDTELSVPSPPAAVRALLDRAPAAPYERVQFLRQALFNNVVGAGPGVPATVSPDFVVSMLNGAKASPYEIAAAEVLLARWAGVPARLGFGFYGGQPQAGGVLGVRPRDGANWLEIHLDRFGWVPLIGAPVHAVSTLDANPQNKNLRTQPSDRISLTLYVPTQSFDPILLYEIVRFWLAIVAPFVLAAILAAVFAPWPAKLLRSRRRRRWARGRGPLARIAVEYAELRDLATDLRAGDPHRTPLEFLDELTPDAEHEELAWLVTRALWGDLQRDLRREDVAAAAEMARSLRRRLAAGQPMSARLLAASSRASLRSPYDASLPNAWAWARAPRQPRRRRRVRLALRRRSA